MNRRVLKYHVAAALFSAAFLFGMSPADAYTYSGGTVTVDQVAEDENDLVVTGGANVICNSNVKPQQSTIITNSNPTTKDDFASMKNTYFIDLFLQDHSNINDDPFVNFPKGLANGMTLTKCNEYLYCSTEKALKARPGGGWGNAGEIFSEYDENYGELTLFNHNIVLTKDVLVNQDIFYFFYQYWGQDTKFSITDTFNDAYFDFIIHDTDFANIKTDGDKVLSLLKKKYPNLYNVIFEPASYIDDQGNKVNITRFSTRLYIMIDNSPFFTQGTVDSPITISNKSTLSSKGNVQTSKAINVSGDSYLKAAGSIAGGDIYSDKAIISTTNDQGESIIAPGNITATGTLKSDTYIGAVSGAVSGNTVYSGGDIVSANSIKAGGLAKGKSLNVVAINAASASITGNQSISGIFTTSGQAKLNGGAALSNKKITGLSAGTLSADSTEAVNGSQLNTIKQKLASAGKAYSAGSDVAISSANAISVAKNGTVASGNTGIITGGTVYKITSALNNSLDALKASVNSHQSTLTTLSQGLSDLKSSVTNINSSVASATKNLSTSLTTRLQSDMGNLSADGKNVIRNMVSSTLKSMNSMSISNAAPVSAIATYEANDVADSDSISSIRTDLDLKASKSDYDKLSNTVASNTKTIGTNEESIQKNTTAISDLKSTKADVDGSNISVDGYADKLGVGKVESGNTGLVLGDSVYGALDKKADIGYVAGGLSMVSAQLDSMSQRMTADMNRVGAGASALTGLHPTSYDASDKLSFASGYGHYKNANTSALGAFYHPNEKTMVSVAGTIGNKDAMLSAGVSIKVGMGDYVSKVIVTPKMFSAQEVTNQSIRDHVDTQAERIRQIEMALQNR